MKKRITPIFHLIPWLLLIISIILFSTSCNMKSGNTVSIKLPLLNTFKLSGSNHKAVYGAGHGPLKVKYFKLGDTIPSRNELLIVTNSIRLNRKIAYIEQGYKNASMHKLKKIFYNNCRSVQITDTITINYNRLANN